VSWAGFLAAIAGPLVRRIALALGFGVVSFAGLSVVKAQIDSAVQVAWQGLAADVYAVISMGGFVDAVAYWLAAITTVVAYTAISRLAPMPGGPP